MMKVITYLSFPGSCEEAFAVYATVLGGRLGEIFRYRGSPMADQAPADWQDKVMHGNLTLGDQELMGSDVVPEQYEVPSGFTLSVQLDDTVEAERIFGALSEQGRIVMPLEQTFWAARFGMVVDRFGIPWTVNCDESAPAKT
jgi:PhnB protein